MFNSTALEVVAGLVFIYLLYSLLVTIVSELVATTLGLRARNLKEAVDRMLNDEKPKTGFLQRLWDTLKLIKNPKGPVVDSFYANPEIKYLGSSGVFTTPSYFKASSFSRTLISMLFGKGTIDRETADSKIKDLVIMVKNDKGESEEKKLDAETAEYIRSLWQEAKGDLEKFKLLLEGWFDRTMEQTIEWYKRKIRVVTLLLGLLLAWFFNADTFFIAKNLANDRDAREKLVSMANAYIESNQYSTVTDKIENTKATVDTIKRLDTLLAIANQLQADLAKAGNILGSGCCLPDSAKIIIGPAGKKTSLPMVESAFLLSGRGEFKNGSVYYSCSDKWCYFFWLLYHHFFGFLVTAIAISLGAPFWFDLLSKIMQLRTSKKEETVSAAKTAEDKTNAVTVNINPKTGEEAAG